MLVKDPSGAQIELILASNDAAQIRQLRHDLKASKFAYSFVQLSERVSLLTAATRQIGINGGQTPIVMVINYPFAGTECEGLLQAARQAFPIAAIECVVTDPPGDDALRQRLIQLGARLFDGNSAETAQQFTLH